MPDEPESHELSDRPDGADCWSEIKSETGFATYKDFFDEYITGLKRRKEGSTNIIKSLESFRGSLDLNYWRLWWLWRQDSSFRCSLFDLSETGSLSMSFFLKSVASEESCFDGSTKILTALRHPPKQASFRILLVEEHFPSNNMYPRLIDAIGLGLRVWPDFFAQYIAMNMEDVMLPWRELLRTRLGIVGRAVFTVARDYLPGRPSCPPVMLIMGQPRFDVHPQFSYIRTESVLFTKPASAFSEWSPELAWPKTYEHLFKDRMKQYERSPLDIDAVVICSLIPLLETCLVELRNVYDDANGNYLRGLGWKDRYSWKDKIGQSDMETIRFKLRRLVRYSEQCMSDSKRYLRTQGIIEPESYEAFRNINEEAKPWLDDARALEVEIRDKLQLQVGSLALEESKKSIQMSNIQIEESKRVKVVTILAFVYVPLNLATSIFGMNIQQLNQNGQHIRVFLITAAIALLLTFFVWFCIAQITAYVQWREQHHAWWERSSERGERWPKKGRNYHFIIRATLLCMLLHRGHLRWMWITGAWIRILTNERAGRHQDFANLNEPAVEEFCNEETTACDYVCRFIKNSNSFYWFSPICFERGRTTEEPSSISQTSTRSSTA